MYRRSRNQGKIAQFFVDNSLYLIMIAVFGAVILCLLQWIIKPQSLTLFIISLIVLGAFLTVIGLLALVAEGFGDFSFIIMGVLGVLMLGWAGLLLFKPENPIAAKTRAYLLTKKETIKTDLVDLSLDISPTSYYPGEKGQVTIQVENQSEYPLTLETVMFETFNQFFEGFIVDYESAQPPLSERKEKLGISTALFFLQKPLEIPAGEGATFTLDIVANKPGDYTSDFSVVLFVDAGSTAVPRSIPALDQEIYMVIFPPE